MLKGSKGSYTLQSTLGALKIERSLGTYTVCMLSLIPHWSCMANWYWNLWLFIGFYLANLILHSSLLLQTCSWIRQALWLRMSVVASNPELVWNNHCNGIWNSNTACNVNITNLSLIQQYRHVCFLFLHAMTEQIFVYLVRKQVATSPYFIKISESLFADSSLWASLLLLLLFLQPGVLWPGLLDRCSTWGLHVMRQNSWHGLQSTCASGRISWAMSVMCQPHRGHSLLPIFSKPLSIAPTSARQTERVNLKTWAEFRNRLEITGEGLA